MVGFVRFVDKLSLWVGHSFAWCILILTFGTSYEVFVRYVLRAPTGWSFDMASMMYGSLFLMAGAYTLSRGGHVRGDVLYRTWAPVTQARVDLVLYILFYFPATLALMYAGVTFAAQSWRFKEVSIFSPANIPVYPLKTLIPIAGLLLFLQGVAEVMRCLQCIRAGSWPLRLHDVEELESAILHAQEDGIVAEAPGDLPMTDPQLAVVMMGLFIALIFLGFPIAFTLLALAVFFGFYAMDFRVLNLIVTNTYDIMTNDVLVAVPLFLFMGYVVERSNILERLFSSIQIAARNVPGSLAVATLITCALFATATGIVGAVVTLMGLLAFPAMLKAGYDTKLSAGVICAGGTLGILIPPSIMLIVYGAAAGVSVVKLYAAAMFPGFLLAGLYLVYVIGRAVINPSLAPKLPREQADVPFAQILLSLATSFLPLAVLIMSVLGAILFGLATPTEAASIGALGALVLAAIYRALSWDRLREALFLTARTSAMVCFLFIGSWNFASVFSYLGGEQVIEALFLGMNLNTVTFLLLSQFIIFLLGWPLEWSEIIIIFVPIFLPLLPHFGVDPLFFGILVALNLQTSFLTPPMAMSAYYLKGIAPPQVQLTQIFGGCMPFLSMVFLAMVLVYVFPQIVMWLPDIIYR